MAQVDVIIPVYNTPIGYVRQALDSVVAQTFTDWCAVVVNDGSAPDYTTQLEALVQGYAEPRIRYVKSENRGLPAARNLGISSSDSPFVALLDSDDAWYPHKLARQLELMQAHPDVVLLHACTDLLMGDGESALRRMPPKESGTNGLSQHDALVRMLDSNFVGVNTVLFRRASGEAAGLFDGSFRSLEDKEFWIRMLLAGYRFLHVPETLGIYRMHATNMSKDVEKMRSGRMKLIEKVDSLVGTGPAWLKAEWPALRRSMVRHAYHEVVETYLESGRYSQALRHTMPWYSGVSLRSARLFVSACLGTVGLTSQHAKP